jgi:hypothetical protein
MELLLAGAGDTAVARELGVSRRTVYQWRVVDVRFRAAMQRRRRALYESAADRLRANLSAALDVLERHVRDPYAPTALRAARAMLALARVGKAAADVGEDENRDTAVNAGDAAPVAPVV